MVAIKRLSMRKDAEARIRSINDMNELIKENILRDRLKKKN